MTSIPDPNSEPALFNSVDHAALAWVESNNDYSRLGKLYRASEKRRKLAAEYLDGELTVGNMIEVEGRRFRFTHKLRNTPSWKDAFNAVKSIVNASMRETMDTALENNTSESVTPALEEIPVN